MSTRITPAEAAALPFPPGRLSSLVIGTPDIEVRHYAPRNVDNQTPHDQDELYFVISGSGTFRKGPVRAGRCAVRRCARAASVLEFHR
jgi:mannose-6-phosphate isomerase-like protein (cupin superfamily)